MFFFHIFQRLHEMKSRGFRMLSQFFYSLRSSQATAFAGVVALQTICKTKFLRLRFYFTSQMSSMTKQYSVDVQVNIFSYGYAAQHASLAARQYAQSYPSHLSHSTVAGIVNRWKMTGSVCPSKRRCTSTIDENCETAILAYMCPYLRSGMK